MNKSTKIVLLLIIIFYACKDVNNNLLSQKTYYSPLNNGVTFFNFTNDSIYFYNSETNKKISYKTKYKDGKIVINNNKIDVLKKHNKIIFIDKKHFFIDKDTIVLNKIKLNNNNNNKISITNEYWFKNFVKQDVSQSIWYYFKEKNKVDIYLSNDKDTSYYSHNYDIIKFGNHKIITMPFFFEKKSFLIKRIENNKLILFTYNNFEDSTFQIALSKYEKPEQAYSLLYNEWVKIDSINAFELPHKLKINESQMIIGKDTIYYELGLKNKYLLFNDGYKSAIGNVFITKINKLTEDTLILERKSRLGKEIGVYKTISQW